MMQGHRESKQDENNPIIGTHVFSNRIKDLDCIGDKWIEFFNSMRAQQ